MSDKNTPDKNPDWIKEITNTLDRSLDELDQPVRDKLSKRRQQLMRSATKNRVLKRTAWVGMAAAASVMAIMIVPGLQQPERLVAQDELSPLLQHMELLEAMDMLEAMGEEPGDV
jgi:hypothetical protein